MKKYIFIPARSNSKRFYRKVFKKFGNTFLLKYLYDRLSDMQNVTVIILTSIRKTDDRLSDLCAKNNMNCFRGPLNNLSLRFILACEKYNIKSFARINGDSPLIDVNIIKKLFDIFEKKKKYHFFTNIYPRSYPVGQSVEIYKYNTLKKYYKKFNKFQQEHVGEYLYRNNKVKKFNLKYKKDLSKINMSINTRKDYIFLKKILKKENYKKNISLNKLIKHF